MGLVARQGLCFFFFLFRKSAILRVSDGLMDRQMRSQEFATAEGQKRGSGGRNSPSGVQGQSPGGGLMEAGDKC